LFLVHQARGSCNGLVEGDDAVFGLNINSIRPEHFESLGFRIKMNYKTTLLDTTFCGNNVTDDGARLLVLPEQIAKFAWSNALSYQSAKTEVLMKLLRAKAMSLYCNAKYTPIASKLALKTMQLIGPGGLIFEPSNRWWDMHVMKLNVPASFVEYPIPWSDRMRYYELTGIDPPQQLHLEAFIDRAVCLADLQLPYQFMNVSYVSELMSR